MAKLPFASDYACCVHPRVAAAVNTAMLSKPSRSYGEDDLTAEATEWLRQQFGPSAQVLYTNSGTAANRIALTTLLGHSCHAVICASDAHINKHECGSLESHGFKLLPAQPRLGKLASSSIADIVQENRQHVHQPNPTVVSIANPTESGVVYTADELELLIENCHRQSLLVHIDGARMANAAAHLGISKLSEITFAVGADVVTLGATKNGGCTADAVIFPNRERFDDAQRLHKQLGQLAARTHALAAEFQALFEDNLWLQLATHSNAMAQMERDHWVANFSDRPIVPVESNALFVKMPGPAVDELAQKVDFNEWPSDQDRTVIRLMCSWQTTQEQVEELAEILIDIRGLHG